MREDKKRTWIQVLFFSMGTEPDLMKWYFHSVSFHVLVVNFYKSVFCTGIIWDFEHQCTFAISVNGVIVTGFAI